jgi:hypothetical protein
MSEWRALAHTVKTGATHEALQREIAYYDEQPAAFTTPDEVREGREWNRLQMKARKAAGGDGRKEVPGLPRVRPRKRGGAKHKKARE